MHLVSGELDKFRDPDPCLRFIVGDLAVCFCADLFFSDDDL